MKNEVSIIINSGKCYWGKCIFCGWGKKESPRKSYEELVDFFSNKFEKICHKLGKVDRVKIFVSGSVLDENQIDPEFINWLYEYLHRNNVSELVLETLPEFVTEEKAKWLSNLSGRYRIKTYLAVGLEVADDKILQKLGKSFRLKDYENMVEIAKRHDLRIRTYILVNAPFTDKNTFDASVEYALKKSDEVVLINLYPHRDTTVIFLWLSSFRNALQWYLENKPLNVVWRPLSRKEFEEWVGKWKDHPKIEVDYENLKFVPKFPNSVIRMYRKKIRGAKIDNLVNPVYEAWFDYIVRIYEPPKDKDILLFLPCAFRKPYRRSKTHKAIARSISGFQIFKRIHRVVVSNPGIIPWEFQDYWPFNAYDWPEWEETLGIQELYYKVTKKRVLEFLKAHKDHYKHFLVYMKIDSLTYRAIIEASEELGIQLYDLMDHEIYKKCKEESKNPLIHEECLLKLREKLKEFARAMQA